MTATTGSRTGRVCVLIVDDEPGITELLSVHSEPGRTEFTVRLPLAADTATAASPAPPTRTGLEVVLHPIE